MKHSLLVLFLTAAIPLQPKIPLSQAIRDALTRSATLKNQKLEEAAIQVNWLGAQLRKWFTIDFSATYRYSSDTMRLTAETFPFAEKMEIPHDAVLASSPASTFDLKISLTQPIYTGGALKNSALLEQSKLKGEKQVTRLRAGELVIKIKVSYFTCQLLQKKIASLTFLLGNLKLHFARLENLFKEELIKKTDILETRSHIVETEINLQELQQALEMEKVQFKRLTEVSFDEVDPGHSEAETSYEESLHLLRTAHPLLKVLAEKIEQSAIQKKIISASVLPQVAGFAELHFGKPGMNYFNNRWTPYFLGGMSLSLPVFHWGKPRRDQLIVGIFKKKIENQRDELLEENEKILKQLFIQKAAALAKMILLENLVQIAEEETKIKEKMYEENQIDHISYLMAATQLERVQSQINELQVQQELIKVNIWAVIGKIPEEES